MNYIIVGTNHVYSPLEIRERISFSRGGLKNALNMLKESHVLNSAVVLSTCNRVEIHACVNDAGHGIKEIENFLYQYHEITENRLSPHLYRYKGEGSLKHLLQVASGLDSLIIGETQILGQIKKAVAISEES